jgi:hypothetical protein
MPNVDAEVLLTLVIVCSIALGFGLSTVIEATYKDAVDRSA